MNQEMRNKRFAGLIEMPISDIRCPDCGDSMVEMDKTVEKGFSFTWYHCSRDSCCGQWLERRRAVR